MKRLTIVISFTALACAGALFVACSSSDSTGSSSGGDSGTTSSTSSGGGSTSSGSSSGDTTPTDTCRPAGGTCQCSCAITGQTLDTTKTCIQPAAGSGECHKVCCTGPIDSGASSTSSSSGSSGISDSGADSD